MNITVNISGMLEEIDACHFSHAVDSGQDVVAGDRLAHVIGETYIDFQTQSPVTQWTAIAKALRIHGFDINFQNNTK